LQLGLTEADVSGALLCLDVNEQIVDEALRKGCNLIVSHHPLLFRGLKQISGADYVQRCVIKALKNDIVIVSMHTNMDNAQDGVNWKIAERLGLQQCQFFAQKQVGDIEAGSGVVGLLSQPMAADDFILMVKKLFGVECALCNELLRRPISKVALCGGAGDFLLSDAISLGADAFITGEMHYHQYFGYEQHIQICVIGHYQSEQFTTEIFRDIINKECPGVRTEIAETCTNPILYI
jgi:dinuclear metal center YbgI/SA1388 family protein